VSDLVYVFGYASLVELNGPGAVRGRLRGYRRHWGVAMNNWEGGDAVKHFLDPETGERLDDVLVFRVADLGEKEIMLADDRGVFFTTPHWNGYSAVLMRIPSLAQIDRDELRDLVAEAWLTRAQKRVAKAWLAEQGIEDA